MTSNLELLERMKNNIYILHYSSSNMREHPVKISSITLSKYNQNSPVTFSIASKSENEMLYEFFEHIKNNLDKIYVGWNLKDITYGTQVLERRYRELLGEEPPIINNVFDLDGILEKKYGKKYVGHEPQGKLYNLLELNKISCMDFLSGKTEADLYEKKDFRKIEMSNSRKVMGINLILKLMFDNNLKTNTSIIWKASYKIDNSPFLKVVGYFFAIMGFLSGMAGLILN